MSKSEFLDHVTAKASEYPSFTQACEAWGIRRTLLCDVIAGRRALTESITRKFGYTITTEIVPVTEVEAQEVAP